MTLSIDLDFCSTCFVVFATYDPTTIRPPLCSLFIPRSLGKIGALGIIPILAETKLAAVRHKNCLPLSSACHIKHKRISGHFYNLITMYQKIWKIDKQISIEETCLDHSSCKNCHISFASSVNYACWSLLHVKIRILVCKYTSVPAK